MRKPSNSYGKPSTSLSTALQLYSHQQPISSPSQNSPSGFAMS